MQRAEKQGETDQNNSHCFPSIEKACDQNDESCNSFRPMFQPQDKVSGNHNAAGGGHETLEQIRKKRFVEGLEAGKAEACKIVQKELESPIHQFLNENDRYSDCFSHITNNYSNHIVELALTIVKKILGDPTQVQSEHLEPISQQLQLMLTEQYRLSAKFNHDDIEALTEVLACVRPQWKQADALDIMGDDETRQGQMILGHPDESIEIESDKFKQKVEQILSSI